MTLDLDRNDLESLIKGSSPAYSVFNNPLLKLAGHSYSDQYGRNSWYNLDKLSDEQLYRLYTICKDSRFPSEQ